MTRFRLLLVFWSLAFAPPAHSFCGVYVASGSAQLFNHRSQVVLARDGDRTVLTMSSDYQGDPRRFALVVPVPTVLDRSQVHVAANGLIEHIDAYSAPRLVEYWDPDPCPAPMPMLSLTRALSAPAGAPPMDRAMRTRGVTIEAQFSVAEYDILILSATESQGLVRWLDRKSTRLNSR